MALTYRSPLEENFTAYDSTVQAAIASTSANYYRDREVDLFSHFNFALKPVAKRKLTEAGIYLSPLSAMPHSHPVCKTLENSLLYIVLPSLLDNRFAFVGIKKFKIEFLRSRNPKITTVQLLNRYVTSADLSRYGPDFVKCATKTLPGCARRRPNLEGCTLRDLVPDLALRNSRYIFLHDELHYWGVRDLISFLEVVKPVIMYATVVYPPELLRGASRSLHPWCYEFEVVGKNFLFYPDGVRSEAYEQPISGGFLLECKRLLTPDGSVFNVNLVHSKFAHHLVAITAGELIPERTRSFGPFEATTHCGLEPLTRNVGECFPVSYDVVSRVYRYLRTLKKPDVQSAMAKLSQLLPEPTGVEIKFLQDFSKLVIDTNTVTTMIKPDRMKIFLAGWLKRLPKVVADKFVSVREVALDAFVAAMEPYTFRVELKDVDWNYKHRIDIFSLSEADFGVDLPSLIDCRFTSGGTPELPLHHGAPYVCVKAESERYRRQDVIFFNPITMENFIMQLIKENFLHPHLRRISARAISGQIRKVILAAKSLVAPKRHICQNFLLDHSRMRRLTHRVISKFAPFLLCAFAENPLLWVLQGSYNSVKSLTSTQHYEKRGFELEGKWAQLIAGSFGGLVTPVQLRRGQGVASAMLASNFHPYSVADLPRPLEQGEVVTEEAKQAQIGEHAVTNARQRAAKEHAQPVAEVHEEKGGQKCKVLECTCSLSMPVSDLHQASEHGFTVRESLRGRKAGWYSKNGEPYVYNGGAHTSQGWPAWIDLWLELNGLEVGLYDSCLYQVYDGGASIGFHADDEEIFAKGAPILTCNITGEVVFKVRCSRGQGSISLSGASAFVMPEGFQETHKHSVINASHGRSSATFRKLAVPVVQTAEPKQEVQKPASIGDRKHEGGEQKATSGDPEVRLDPENQIYGASAIEESVTEAEQETHDALAGKYGEEAYLGALVFEEDFAVGSAFWYQGKLEFKYTTTKVKGDGNCFWYAMEKTTGMKALTLKECCKKLVHFGDVAKDKALEAQMGHEVWAENEAVMAAACVARCVLKIYSPEYECLTVFEPKIACNTVAYLELRGHHFQPMNLIDGCVVKAICDTLGRRSEEVMAVIERELGPEALAALWAGKGVALPDLEIYCGAFDIRATIVTETGSHELNSGGGIGACFSYEKGHLVFKCMKERKPSVELFSGEFKERSITDASKLYIETKCTAIDYLGTIERAKVLTGSLHSGTTGILSSKLFNDAEHLLTEEFPEGSTKRMVVGAILGTFGAGKSSIFRQFFMLNQGRTVHYVSPRKALAEEFKNKLFCSPAQSDIKHGIGKSGLRKAKMSPNGVGKHWSVSTFEVFLKKAGSIRSGSAVVIDEIQLYPPGYLDFLCFKLAEGVTVYVGGDPCQSDYDNEKDRLLIGSLPGDCDRLLDDKSYEYNIMSQRFRNSNFRGRLPCDFGSTLEGAVEEQHLLFTGIDEMLLLETEYKKVFLVSSFDEKKIVESYFLGESTVLTFGESTGLNFERGTILITHNSAHTSEKRWITAISRFSHNVCFVNLLGTSWSNLLQAYKDRCLGKFLARRAGTQDLMTILPGKPHFKLGFEDRVGKDEGLREEKVVGDPWLKGMIDLLQEVDQLEAEIGTEEMQSQWFKTHLPQAELEGVRAQWVHRLMAKEFREVRMGHLLSEQFTDDYAKEKGQILTNAAERFEAIYPRHRANDTVTFIMAVKKRLRFSRPSVECAKLIEADAYGHFLLTEFLKKIPLRRQHNKEMMAQAKWEFEEKKTSKSSATIENHSGRSCRDWLIDIGLVFSKSQLCTKFDNRFRVAKAAQSIVCFQHEVLCRFAPYMRYIEKKLLEVLPPNMYIHSGKGLEELNDWVIKGKFDGICTESDYEAFDASQDQYIVSFETAIMKYLGLPRDLIEDYRFIKTHLGSKMGNFAIMRFSGEASTFLFNTMANMLFTFLRYELKGGEFICFAGDDMCASARLSKKTKHEGFLNKLKLKAKVFFVDKPTFCGWHLCPDGIYKKPQLVLERMCIAKEKANLVNCIDNYAIEVAFAYKLGERALNRMDEEEVAAFYNCVRIIIKNKHLLKSNVVEVFQNT